MGSSHETPKVFSLKLILVEGRFRIALALCATEIEQSISDPNVYELHVKTTSYTSTFPSDYVMSVSSSFFSSSLVSSNTMAKSPSDNDNIFCGVLICFYDSSIKTLILNLFSNQYIPT